MPNDGDHATLIDSLGRISLVTRLACAVRTCVPPRVYGVHGDWGAGKTSFLQQLHRTLDGLPARKEWVDRQNAASARLNAALTHAGRSNSCQVPVHTSTVQTDPLVVWFEAWRYQHEAAPIVALLHEMRGQLGTLARAKMEAFKLTEVAVRSALMQLEQIAKFAWLQSADAIAVRGASGGLVQTIQNEGDRWEREHLAEKLPAESIREQLEHAVNELLGRKDDTAPGEGRRVVVLIDDLDRCEPQATYRLLEGIKIYLNIPNCVFVLGMDQRIIEDAIAESAPGAKDNPAIARRRAREYLEKLFQEVYHLPIVRDVPSQLAEWLPNDLARVPATTRDSIKELLVEYEGCLPANPRKLKAFAAVLWRFLTEPEASSISAANFSPPAGASSPAARHPYEALVVIMASLYHFHPEIYRVMEAHPRTFYEQVWHWCGRSQPNEESDHSCMLHLERSFKLDGLVDRSTNTFPELKPLHADYSRGNVFRIQRLIYDAREYTPGQVGALLLR